MRTFVVPGWAVVAALALACSDSTDPAAAPSVTGAYELVSHDGLPVPHQLTSRRCNVEVRWGSLRLSTAGEFELFAVYHGSCAGAPDSVYDVEAVDSYRFTAGRLEFPPEGLGGSVSAHLRGSHVVVTFANPLLDRRSSLEFAPGPAPGLRLGDVQAETPGRPPAARGRLVARARPNWLVRPDSAVP